MDTTPDTTQNTTPDTIADYSLNNFTDEDNTHPAAEGAKEKPAQEDFAMEWPEGFEPTHTFSELATQTAQETGLSGKQAGAYAAALLSAYQKLETEQLEASDAVLKNEWGTHFEQNLTSSKKLLNRLIQEGHIEDESAKFLMCPRGMKLLHGISRFIGESPAAGTQTPGADARSWANEVLTNPSHPDYAAFRDPESPRWRELNTRYNSIMFKS